MKSDSSGKTDHQIKSREATAEMLAGNALPKNQGCPSRLTGFVSTLPERVASAAGAAITASLK
jgi:hypothetical protein